MKGILRGKKTCGLSKGVSEVGAHKGDSLIRGREGCQHEESIHQVGGLVWLIKSSGCVCVLRGESTHRMKRASTNPLFVSCVENRLTQNQEGIYTCEQLNLGC